MKISIHSLYFALTLNISLTTFLVKISINFIYKFSKNKDKILKIDIFISYLDYEPLIFSNIL